jgi:hypothetical protein
MTMPAQSLFLTRRLPGESELDEIEAFGDQGEILAGLKIAGGGPDEYGKNHPRGAEIRE